MKTLYGFILDFIEFDVYNANKKFDFFWYRGVLVHVNEMQCGEVDAMNIMDIPDSPMLPGIQSPFPSMPSRIQSPFPSIPSRIQSPFPQTPNSSFEFQTIPHTTD